MTHQEYLQKFNGMVNGSQKDRAEKALDLALDIRKFEIELYWKRATYFWAFIAAALAGYAVLYKPGAVSSTSWLSLLFSSLGLMFSTAWYLVNRGSKFWQNNWERHVDLLEDQVFGPLYKTIARDAGSWNPLTAPGQYSVSKINQILSFFVMALWWVLFAGSALPFFPKLSIDHLMIAIVVLTFLGLVCLFSFGRSANRKTRTKLESRELLIEP